MARQVAEAAGNVSMGRLYRSWIPVACLLAICATASVACGRDAGVTTYADNALNQYTSISGGATTPLHDAKGNLVRNERGYGFTYDFENRLTRVFSDSDLDGQFDGGEPVHAEYVVDALGRRAVATVAGVTTYRYYDGSVVVAEFDAGAPATPIACYLNGPNYLDEKLLIKAGGGAGGSDEYYVLLKDLYTVAGVTDADGDLFEWYTYTGYGLPTIHGTGLLAAAPLLFGDADGDCDVDLADLAGFQAFFSGAGNPHAPGGADFDSDSDGDVDFADFEAFAANLNGPGSGSCATRVNPFAFTGQRVDVLDGGALVVYDYKARVYDPLHGRFQQRDPAEFADSYNLYEYAASRPTVLTDPTGEFSLPSLSVGSAIRGGLHALNAYGNLRAVKNLATALVTGVGVQQALTSIIIDAASDRLGGKFFDAGLRALNRLRGLVGVRGGALTKLIGDVGEARAGLSGNKLRIDSSTGTASFRVVDDFDEGAEVLREVKNAGELSLTNQLVDILHFSIEKGYTFELVVRKGTKLSGPLQELVDQGFVVLRREL